MEIRQVHHINFNNVEKQYESYQGINVKLLYFVCSNISANVRRDEGDVWAHSFRVTPDDKISIKEVGMEYYYQLRPEKCCIGQEYASHVRSKTEHIEPCEAVLICLIPGGFDLGLDRHNRSGFEETGELIYGPTHYPPSHSQLSTCTYPPKDLNTASNCKLTLSYGSEQNHSLNLLLQLGVVNAAPPTCYVCNAGSFLELLTLIKYCQTHLPFLSLTTLSTAVDLAEYQHVLDQHFRLHRSDESDGQYAYFEAQNRRLCNVASKLSTAPVMQHPFSSCTRFHVPLPSDNQALVIVGNLRLLLRSIYGKQLSLYREWSKMLDHYPETTEKMLRSVMDEARHLSLQHWEKVSPVSFLDFSTLGVGRWLNDEIINFFVKKWCHAGTTLGLNTFFACKFLFQDNTCINAKTGTMTAADEEEAVKWCRKAQKALSIDFWDSVFIPIHESSSHWYSAYIDFRLKRIEIYDSLRATCVANRQKPVLLRKNANLMLVLMWLTEVLGRMRDEPVCLNQNGKTDWLFDPHSKVHFQPNTFDCGVHTLWHLQHVLEFRQVRLGEECCPDWLAFTDNMIGKRMRLAHEIYQCWE
ncbi:hypothetical protein D9757_013246 [Collybiopsis confluens]|uniref:Ubiquitin-like protease family profile domain-containing protein n=1 Tax=Collybiopsis confluens TaxID=2823264 RepID=A0A8H5D0N6_9AGAR|nr:hypothetical protein D9757_013246 [Collybiopsis confluens]